MDALKGCSRVTTHVPGANRRVSRRNNANEQVRAKQQGVDAGTSRTYRSSIRADTESDEHSRYTSTSHATSDRARDRTARLAQAVGRCDMH